MNFFFSKKKVWRVDFIDVVRWIDAQLSRGDNNALSSSSSSSSSTKTSLVARRAPLKLALLRLLKHCGSISVEFFLLLLLL